MMEIFRCSPRRRDPPAVGITYPPGGAATPLYGQVDLAPGPVGPPLVLGAERREPTLRLSSAPGAAVRRAGGTTAAQAGDGPRTPSILATRPKFGKVDQT